MRTVQGIVVDITSTLAPKTLTDMEMAHLIQIQGTFLQLVMAEINSYTIT